MSVLRGQREGRSGAGEAGGWYSQPDGVSGGWAHCRADRQQFGITGDRDEDRVEREPGTGVLEAQSSISASWAADSERR
jgi:hypothetical protein